MTKIMTYSEIQRNVQNIAKMMLALQIEPVGGWKEEFSDDEDVDFFPTPKPIVLVPILKGAMLFASDLLRFLPRDTTIEPVIANREFGIEYIPSFDTEGKDIWVIDCTCCTGYTLQSVIEVLKNSTGVQEIKSAVLMLVPTKDKRVFTPYIHGQKMLSSPVGYGTDYQGKHRGLVEIFSLKEIVDEAKMEKQ